MLKLPYKSPVVLNKFFEENQDLVYRYMVLSIQKAVAEKRQSVNLFSFGENNAHLAVAYSRDYHTILKSALDSFIKNENYEAAAQTKKVMERWAIEQLLNNTKQ